MFEINNIQISEEDISKIENHFGFTFNDGQKSIIHFWNSADIQACPGSGKTTALAAKLIALQNKIPNTFNKGICVITHTNVAVQEIKEKLGKYSKFYFTYPNHFGTIQSVIDKFFTIPYYKNKYKCSPIISNEAYFDAIERFKSRAIEGAKTYLSRSKNIDFIGTLSYNRTNFDISSDINKSSPVIGKHTPSYATLVNLKDNLLKSGFIKYDEAYSIAYKYLRENPQLIELFSKRFPIVFIDEMQDMETHQSELINLLCENKTSVIQRIGDTNQSIYNYSTQDSQNKWTPKINDKLQLNLSTRVSDNIASLVKDICVNPQEMKGWSNDKPIPITIIVYDDNTIQNVKNKYGELLLYYGFKETDTCKAIGARLSDSKLNINSYWSEFNRGYNSKDFSNINSFIEAIDLSMSQSKNVKEIRKIYLNIICKSLKICGVKNINSNFYFTPFSLYKYFKSLENNTQLITLNNNLTYWITSFISHDEKKKSIQNYVNELLVLFNSLSCKELLDFFNNSNTESLYEKSENKIFEFNTKDNSVKIQFDTIHSVKGETHKATLYLETYNRVYDIGSKILDFIVSTDKQKVRKRKDNAFKKRLPLAYVAMTRATHFVCLAVHKDRFGNEYESYFENNNDWRIEYL